MRKYNVTYEAMVNDHRKIAKDNNIDLSKLTNEEVFELMQKAQATSESTDDYEGDFIKFARHKVSGNK